MTTSHGQTPDSVIINNQWKIAIDLDPAFYHWRGGWRKRVVLVKAISNEDVTSNGNNTK